METKIIQRKANKKLIEKLKDGELHKCLEYIRDNSDLRLEIRIDGHIKIYFEKCLALDLGASSFNVDTKYFIDGTPPKLAKANLKSLIENNPAEYFESIRAYITAWKRVKVKKDEFVHQQKIASANQDRHNKYVIIDMEYNLSQSAIEPFSREKRNGYDLLGINRETMEIELFEVKYGSSALGGTAGVDEHIKDFERNFISGFNIQIFKAQLKRDIVNIIADKNKLGLIDFELSDKFHDDNNEISFKIIMVYDNQSQMQNYKSKFGKHNDRYETIFVASNGDHILA